jgi:ribonuclease J
MSALALMAAHDHKFVDVGDDDVVVISAHAIPGNESNVGRVINSLHRAGAVVVHDRIAKVHVSGHASQEELKFMLSLAAPEFFVPVHGEVRQMVHHAMLAEEVGIADDRIVVCEDGDVLTLNADGLHVERDAVPARYLYVDGIVGDVGHGVLRDRQLLAEEGLVVVIVSVDHKSGELISDPEIVTRGWVHAPEAEELLDDAREAVRRSVLTALADGADDPDIIRRHARRALGRFINDTTKRRPQIIPVVIEV